jgi:hypothetical protein
MTPIRAAPNRFALKEFGGKLSIEEFRNMGESAGPVITMPDEMYKYHMTARPKYESSAFTNTSSETKFQDIQNSSTSNETLKLKRPRPLKRDENNLEKSLGIIRKNGVR